MLLAVFKAKKREKKVAAAKMHLRVNYNLAAHEVKKLKMRC